MVTDPETYTHTDKGDYNTLRRSLARSVKMVVEIWSYHCRNILLGLTYYPVCFYNIDIIFTFYVDQMALTKEDKYLFTFLQ